MLHVDGDDTTKLTKGKYLWRNRWCMIMLALINLLLNIGIKLFCICIVYHKSALGTKDVNKHKELSAILNKLDKKVNNIHSLKIHKIKDDFYAYGRF